MPYAAVHEGWNVLADDSVTGVCNPSKFHVEGPIHDEHAADLTDAANKLWRHNGAHLMSWCCKYHQSDAGVPTTSSTSYADLIINNAGHYLQTQYHSTRRRTGASGVPVEMAVLCIRTAGAGTADFRLTDGTNNIDITGAAVGGSLQWFTTTTNISDTPATWKMQHRVSVGTTSIRTPAWSVWEYEA